MTEQYSPRAEHGRIKDINLAHEAAIAAKPAAEDATRSRRIAARDKASGNLRGYNQYRHNAEVDERDAVEAAQRIIDQAGEVEFEGLTNKEAVDLLSYVDVLDGDEAQSAIEYTESSPNAQKYVVELQQLYEKYGWDKLHNLAKALRDKCLDTLKSLGIEPSKFANSESWALWDIAKQHYYFARPDLVEPQYDGANGFRPGDPFSESNDGARKRHEIITRHIGWEADLAIKEGAYSLDRLDSGISQKYLPSIKEVIETGERNHTGQLRSFELAKLGRRLDYVRSGGFDPSEYDLASAA